MFLLLGYKGTFNANSEKEKMKKTFLNIHVKIF